MKARAYRDDNPNGLPHLDGKRVRNTFLNYRNSFVLTCVRFESYVRRENRRFLRDFRREKLQEMWFFSSEKNWRNRLNYKLKSAVSVPLEG